MKAGIIADTHDNLAAVNKAVAVFQDAGVSLVLHAGDVVAPFVAPPFMEMDCGFTGVFGNNDGEILGLNSAFSGRLFRPPHVVAAAGKNILLLHEPDVLEPLRQSGRFDAIIYGHTHKPDIRKGPTHIINPGECCGWVEGKRTVAVWDIENDDIHLLPV